jgi:hypothetical protein
MTPGSDEVIFGRRTAAAGVRARAPDSKCFVKIEPTVFKKFF